jgi:hypothetical protein
MYVDVYMLQTKSCLVDPLDVARPYPGTVLHTTVVHVK